jgi:TetR/AcrR family transcriptional regulator, transcriptional repressor for nem operon
MRRSREEAAETRRTAVETASKLYRERGVDSVSIGDVMAALGMTVGGFYRHFESKEALVAEACARAFADAGRTEDSVVASADDGEALAALLRRYLSRAHRDTAASGCPIPSLVSSVAHQPGSIRSTFTEGVRSLLGRIEKLAPEAEPEARLAAVAGMIGALALARAVNDERLSDRFLHDTRTFWTRALGKRRSPTPNPRDKHGRHPATRARHQTEPLP